MGSNLPWKNTHDKMESNLHSICSYMAMFPPRIPKHFIEKYSKAGNVVLDPFCGRGTTLLEACNTNRIAIGNDKNPLATILSRSKVSVPSRGRITSRIKKLEENFNPNDIDVENVAEKIRMLYSDYTLKQLLYLKGQLNWKMSNVDNFITAMVLGIMHGSSQCYLSISMPNTFSMSPNYVKKYIKKHKLKKPERDVFKLLMDKLGRCYQKCDNRGKVYCQDSRKMSRIKDSSVDLIVTSPPYAKVITYGNFNWIRLWFLSKNEKKVDKSLFASQSIEKYQNFMKDVLREFNRVLKPGAKSVIIIGDVKNRHNDEIINLAENIWKNCAKPMGFKKVGKIIEDVIDEEGSKNPKVSRIWGKTKGNATKVDRILVLRSN